MLWTVNGKLSINSSGELIDCAVCPCPGTHPSPCNDGESVPAMLDLTFTFDGNSVTVPLTWIIEAGSCIEGEGWEYAGPAIEIAPNLILETNGAALCCGFSVEGVWYFSISLEIDGVGANSFATGAGMDELTINDTNPVDYETEIDPLTAGGVTDILYIVIQEPP